MKFLLDNNLSHKLVQALQSSFPGTAHIREVISVIADDVTIWNYAKVNLFVILTKDNDFDDRSRLAGCPPKIVHLVCGNKSTLHILNLIIWRKEELQFFGEKDTENCILKIA